MTPLVLLWEEVVDDNIVIHHFDYFNTKADMEAFVKERGIDGQ